MPDDARVDLIAQDDGMLFKVVEGLYADCSNADRPAARIWSASGSDVKLHRSAGRQQSRLGNKSTARRVTAAPAASAPGKPEREAD